MKNTNFSNLVFRIIGKPEAWHHEYLDVMHKVLDEAESIDDPDNISELEFGDQIINRLRESNDTLAAFNSLLDKSRFKIIILDEDYHPIYHNTNAQTLIKKLSNANNKQLDPILLRQLKNAPLANEENSQNSLQTIHFPGNSNEQLYFRSISSKLDESSPTRIFHLLLMLDQNQQHNDLNPDLVSKFELTEKEQLVLKSLIHGKSIKEIAIEAFISENTVKTHIKSLFRKTNTNSQAAIVGLILTHESQILDSYFDTGSPTIDLNNRDDKEIKLRDGHSIVYREYGPKEGRPLIVFHNGYGCRLTVPNNYREICETTNRRIIIPDRPGVGKTPFIRNHPHGWPERMNEFVDQLELSEFDILGNVIGCHIAIDFAMKADDRLKHIILSSPVVVNQNKIQNYYRESYLQFLG